MHDSSRKRLLDIVDFVSNELRDLHDYQGLDYKKYLTDKNCRRLVERMTENITNAVIDILKIMISEKGLELPDSYADIMKKGGSIYKLNEAQLKHLTRLAKLRNILAHEYLDMKWEMIKGFLKEDQSTIKALIERTKKIISEDIRKNRNS